MNTNTEDLFLLFIAQKHTSTAIVLGEHTNFEQEPISAAYVELLQQHQLDMESLNAVSMLDLIVDWYCLRDGNAAAKSYIDTPRLRVYRFLSSQFGIEPPGAINNDALYFSTFLGLMSTFLSELESSTNWIVIPLD